MINENSIDMKIIRKRYHAQKSAAALRGIEWDFTFDSWLDWWGTDIINRGCKKGQLVMSRKGDTGPYSIANVFKATCSDNCSEGNKGKVVSIVTKEKHRQNQLGKIVSLETKLKMSESQNQRRFKEKLNVF